jgi:uncharacterized protein YdhG (YjbR/CyaY superfamily)
LKPKHAAPKNIDAYVKGFPKDIQEVLQRIRATIQKAAPAAAETIKYGLPTFTLNGNLVHFAAFKKHIGFFPPVRGDAKLQKEKSAYEGEKGNLKFPLDAPIPYSLITRLVKQRVKESAEGAGAKAKS